MSANRSDGITRDQLIRAIQATRRDLPARATGTEALERLSAELEDPHTCEPAYEYDPGEGGPCQTCWEWVKSA